MLNYLLQSNIITLFFNGDSVSMNWIAKLINGLINAIGIVGVGVVVFTLILKLITLPLDVYSKASMRKNSLKMEKKFVKTTFAILSFMMLLPTSVFAEDAGNMEAAFVGESVLEADQSASYSDADSTLPFEASPDINPSRSEF